MHSEAEKYLCACDDKLAEIIRRAGPCKLKPRRCSPFEALLRAITFQQLNGTAAETILRRVLAIYGKRFPTPEAVLNTPDETLRAAGLSGAKTASIKDLAEKSLAGVVPAGRAIRQMSENEIMERLTAVRGIGPWTVEMLLIFTLGRPDVLPVTDYGVRKGVALTYGLRELPAPKELALFGERWKPHRSVAAWYMWRVLEFKTP
jgi:DNA-3-methyladenine glycosylase II